jgi:hypothetical protein
VRVTKAMRIDLDGPKSPCQGCPSRYVGCHSRCELYAAFRRERDAYRMGRNYETIRTLTRERPKQW